MGSRPFAFPCPTATRNRGALGLDRGILQGAALGAQVEFPPAALSRHAHLPVQTRQIRARSQRHATSHSTVLESQAQRTTHYRGACFR